MCYNQSMNILFFGGPGSGKSTVGQRLAEEIKWPWISSGAILRESKEQWVIDLLKTSQLFDDEMMSGLVFSRLDGIENAILDGFPRTLRQAELMVERGIDFSVGMEIEVSVEETLKRLSERGRDQDVETVIMERWEDYQRTKNEIVAFLAGHGMKMTTVQGEGTRDEVYTRVREKLIEVLKQVKK